MTIDDETRKAIERAAGVALKNGLADVARSLLRMTSGRSKAAERAARYRRRRESVTRHVTSDVARDVTESVTGDVTSSVTGDVTPPSPLSHSPLSPETHSQDIQYSSSFSSSTQGPSLEGAGARGARDGWPAAIEITSELRARCVMAGLPEPTPADAAMCLAWHQGEGRRAEDWGARLVWWMGRERMRRGAQAASGTPAPPSEALALVAAYERGVAAGKEGPYACPLAQHGDLMAAVVAHGRRWRSGSGEPIAGADRLAWLEAKAGEFASWLVSRDEKERAFYSSYGPRGFARWLNETNARARAGT